jgi:ribose transport system substrate-binding protein
VKSFRRAYGLVVLPVLLAAVIAGCGSSSSSSSSSASASGSGGQSSSQSSLPGSLQSNGEVSLPKVDINSSTTQAAVAKLIPSQLQQYYRSTGLLAPLTKASFASFTPAKPPWKFCYSETFLENTWRQTALQVAKAQVAVLQKEGIAKGPLVVLNANNNVSTQASQINQLVNEGCNIIWSLPAGPTGICPAVANARSQNVLFLTIVDPVVCPGAVNVDWSEANAAATQATYIAHALHGKGNVLMLTGLPGLALTTTRDNVAKQIFKQAGINVVGQVEGDFTASVAKAATLKWLTTHPGTTVDAIWDGGAMATAGAQAFDQAGRPRPKIVTSMSTDCSFLGYWKQNLKQAIAAPQSPYAAINAAWDVTDRIMHGGKPTVNLIMFPTPQIATGTLSQWYKPSMTVTSTCFPKEDSSQALPASYFNSFFKG